MESGGPKGTMCPMAAFLPDIIDLRDQATVDLLVGPGVSVPLPEELSFDSERDRRISEGAEREYGSEIAAALIHAHDKTRTLVAILLRNVERETDGIRQISDWFAEQGILHHEAVQGMWINPHKPEDRASLQRAMQRQDEHAA